MTFALWVFAAAPTAEVTLSPAGAAIMLASNIAVLLLVGFCLYRVLTLPPTHDGELQGPLRIDTRDTQDAD